MADKLKSKHDKYDSPSTSGYRGKEERMDIDFSDEDEEPHSFVPAALGLHRVGTELPAKSVPSKPVQKLNARGMPTRITKKNRLIFFDDFVEPSCSRQTVKKTPKITTPKKPQKQQSDRKQKSPTKIQMINDKHDKKVETPSEQSIDVRAVHKIGMRLKNLLQLPKSYKWVCFEFFYSNIDKVFFEGTNDFMTCVKECFPQLNTSKLTRMQWCKIRRKLGKPRRSSPVFFTEERKELERKRGLIRYMQQKKSIDTNIKDLTNEIPMQLVVGTKVTAWLWKPYYGLFTGFISAIDTSNYTYRIVFDAPRIGTHSVPDYEVLSNEPPDTLGLPSNSQKFRSRNVIQDMTNLKKSSHNRDSTVPYPLLENIVKLRKILDVKKTKIDCLKKYNTEAEMKQFCGQEIPDDFKIKYARIVSDLEEINNYIQGYLNELQKSCFQLDPDFSSAAMLVPSRFREACHKEASLVLKKNDDGSVKDKAVKELITDLTALLFQVQGLSKSDQSAYGMSILQGSMDQIKDKLGPHHRKMFECNVEVHMRKIQMGLGQKSTSSSIAGSSNN
ncbi:hypothetical protein K1T71_000067 [Dendrolimus kikuchii]|uniref:Uncharacterized protein n=1 Tax=Dendrolimus kikuchii TaxID=765133 RepID=A0ACC1DI55_9NEOP|nr:hypothetical protein K1T71_000067 [Dendrolimus kikuchii]